MAEEDIIFGKNRHFFGGIEPSNMTKFEVVNIGDMWYIDARLPKDTVIDGQTLCTVGGAVIRYGYTDYPRDEFDGYEHCPSVNGAIVNYGNITEDTMIDVTAYVHSGAQFYFRAFPYSVQGVYNRNNANGATINMLTNNTKVTTKTKYTSGTSASRIKFLITMPEEDIEDIHYVQFKVSYTSIAGHKGSTNNFIASSMLTNVEEYGVPAYEINISDVVIGSECTYEVLVSTLNPDTQEVVWSTDVVKGSIVVRKCEYIFGYNLDTNDPDPSTRVSYPSDVDNANFSPAFMDYLTGRFNYGDWPSEPGKYFMPKPCMLTDDGTVAHYLDPDDYSLQEDGVTPSYVSSTTSAVQAMMEWDKIYVYREETNTGIYKFRCSDQPIEDGKWKCWSNYDKNDNEIDHFYTSIYAGVNATPTEGGMAFRSRSGNAITTSDFYSEYTGYIGSTYQNKGWYLGYLADHLLIQDLLVMMGKSTDCQTVFGYGVNTGGHSKTGVLDNKGLFWGSPSAGINGVAGVKVFGMEDYWGNSHRYLAGWLSQNGKQYVKLTWGTVDGSTKTGFAYSSVTGYITASSSSPTGTGPGYISDMLTAPYGRIPIATSGSATTYECDQFNWSASSTVQVHLMGFASGGTTMGPFAAYASNNNSAIGYASANLSFKPLAE